MTKPVTVAGIVALFSILFVAPASRAAANDAREELKNCARIKDNSMRIACYEELGSRVLGEGRTETHVDDVVIADDHGQNSNEMPTKGDTLADDLGGDEFAKKAETYKEANRGRIASCRQGPDRKWSFFFENGQIWKQSDGHRRRFKECDFFVTITKDTFGYKMQIDGDERKYRIRRTR